MILVSQEGKTRTNEIIYQQGPTIQSRSYTQYFAITYKRKTSEKIDTYV